MKRVKILLITVLALLTLYVNGQKINKYPVQRFGIAEGLTTNTVNCLLQDSQGYIWVGTEDGLNGYDGYVFKPFRHDPSDSTSISGNFICDIVEDPSGNLWVATLSGLNYFDKKTQLFTSWKLTGSVNNNTVFSIFIDSKLDIWLKAEGYLLRFNKETAQFVEFEHKNDLFNYWFGYSPNGMDEDTDGNIWFATKDGLHKFDSSAEQFQIFSNKLGGLYRYEDRVNCVYAQGNTIWAGTQNGIWLYSEKNGLQRYLVSEEDNPIHKIFPNPDGLRWWATEQGMLLFDTETKTVVEQLKLGEDDFDEAIFDAFVDKSDIMWLATSNGLVKIDKKPKAFSDIGSGFNEPVQAIAVVGEEVWFGTATKGLYRKLQSGLVKQVPFNKRLEQNISSLFFDSKRRLWIGFEQGLAIYDLNVGKLYGVEDYCECAAEDNLAQKRIFGFTETDDGNLWVSTSNGLYRLNEKTLAIYKNNPIEEGALASNNVRKVIQDVNGRIWVVTAAGLSEYLPEKERFVKSNILSLSEVFGNLSILSLVSDNTGNLWIGTESGLLYLNLNNKNCQFYNQKKGLSSDHIYAIELDDYNRVWLSTNRGLSSLDINSGIFENYGINDGVQGYEFYTGASVQLNGHVYFGGTQGVTEFTAGVIYRNPFAPNVFISNVHKIGRSGDVQNISCASENVLLSYQDYMLSIAFMMPEYTYPEKNRFKYRMEGIGDEWVDIGNSHIAVFPKLAPGKYTFSVVGANSDNVWTSKPTQISLTVVPPIYKSNIAYIAYGVFALFLIYFGTLFATRNLRIANQTIREREIAAAEIAKQKEELSNKNQEITDSMNYAQRIITAMLPSAKKVKQLLPESFVFYKPKEIVSGDFLWVAEKNDKVYLAAIDCTGHGVPGAFMSIIGYDRLRDIIINHGIENPSEILNLLSIGVATTLGNSEDLRVTDGMDIAFCVFDLKQKTLEFAGAINPLYLIRDNNIIEYKGDRFSVGSTIAAADRMFQRHTISLQSGDVVYMFSDGYADQFGGPQGKKFKYRRFRHLLLNLHQREPEEQNEMLENTFQKWRGDLEQVDDLLVIGVKI